MKAPVAFLLSCVCPWPRVYRAFAAGLDCPIWLPHSAWARGGVVVGFLTPSIMFVAVVQVWIDVFLWV